MNIKHLLTAMGLSLFLVAGVNAAADKKSEIIRLVHDFKTTIMTANYDSALEIAPKAYHQLTEDERDSLVHFLKKQLDAQKCKLVYEQHWFKYYVSLLSNSGKTTGALLSVLAVPVCSLVGASAGASTGGMALPGIALGSVLGLGAGAAVGGVFFGAGALIDVTIHKIPQLLIEVVTRHNAQSETIRKIQYLIDVIS